MKPKWIVLGVLIVSSVVWASAEAGTAEQNERVVRIAELEIDPAQVEQYRVALQREIEAAIRVEPGVLTLYAASVKGHKEQVRIFEVYANQAAYEAHLQSAHFKKYKADTAGMVRSLRLMEAEPIMLGSKQR